MFFIQSHENTRREVEGDVSARVAAEKYDFAKKERYFSSHCTFVSPGKFIRTPSLSAVVRDEKRERKKKEEVTIQVARGLAAKSG